MAHFLRRLFGGDKRVTDGATTRAHTVQASREVESAAASQPRVKQISPGEFDLPLDERGLSVLVSAPARDMNVSGPWEIGQTVDGLYEVKKILGHGGMGIVYLVHHVNWNVDLAVKCVLESQKADPEIVRAFLHEADKWIHLGLHPNVVSCYYVRKYGDAHYTFLEYVSGTTLRKLLDSSIELTFQQKLDIAIQVCWGLAHCHKKGMIHRDIKPENVLVSQSQVTDLYDVKLTDFGLVHQQAAGLADQAGPSTAKEQVLAGWGTPAYMAPELFDDPGAISSASDVYALGIAFYELFAGQRPVQQNRLKDWRTIHREAEREPLPLPERLVVHEVIVSALSKRTEDRPLPNDMAAKLAAEYDGEYSRPEPREVDLLADGLNNRALSLFDLGNLADAEQALRKALATDVHHLESSYNLGLLEWRAGRVDDLAVVSRVRESSLSADPVRAALLTAQVELERDDCVAALRILDGLREQLGERQEVHQLSLQARALLPSSQRLLRTFGEEAACVCSVSLSVNGRHALTDGLNKQLKLWEIETGRCLQTFEGHADFVNSVFISADGHVALSGSADKTLRLWNVSTGLCLRTFEGHKDSVNSVVMSADGRCALSGSDDKALRLWDVATGLCLRTFEGHADSVNSVVISGDGHCALSGSNDRTLKLWDVTTGLCLRTFEGHADSVNSVVMSADGRCALSGSDDKTLKLWDVSTGLCLRTFEGHTWGPESVSLSPDSHYALSASDGDGMLKQWEVKTGRCLRSFQSRWNSRCVSISADGRWALSGGAPVDGNEPLSLWAVPGNRSVKAPWELASIIPAENASAVISQFRRDLQNAQCARAQGNILKTAACVRGARRLPGCRRQPEAIEL